MQKVDRIGMLGLGTMGGAMARHLVASGFQVTGFDLDAKRVAEAQAAGVIVAPTPLAVAQSAKILLSSLPDPAAVRAAYFGPDGALEGIQPGTVLVDLSTIDPDTWREVAAAAAVRGAGALDSPVSGGPAEAGSGGLVLLVGGEEAVLERCRPVLEALSSTIHHAGPLGSGHTVKLVNNVMSMCNVLAAAEAMVLGVRAGMDPQRLYEILSTSGGRSHHFLKRFPNVLQGDFTPHFSVALSRKDLTLALNMAARLGLPMPATSAARQAYEVGMAEGLGALDMAGIIALYEQWAGVKVRAAEAAMAVEGGARKD